MPIAIDLPGAYVHVAVRPAALGVSGKPDIPYFTPSAQIAISAVPRSAGTAQALHTVSRTWLRGGSPHRILKKLPVRHATLLRRCAGRR